MNWRTGVRVAYRKNDKNFKTLEILKNVLFKMFR